MKETKLKLMTTRGNGNTKSEALHGIQKFSRSKFQHNKKLSEFDSILYKCRQFDKQKKRTLTFKSETTCVTEIIPKNASLLVDNCELQIQGFDCFTNNNKSLCHRGVLIYTKKCLKAVAVNFSKLGYMKNMHIVNYHRKIVACFIFCAYTDLPIAHLRITTIFTHFFQIFQN